MKDDEIRKAPERIFQSKDMLLSGFASTRDEIVEYVRSDIHDKQITALKDGYISYRKAYCEAESQRIEHEERLKKHNEFLDHLKYEYDWGIGERICEEIEAFLSTIKDKESL